MVIGSFGEKVVSGVKVLEGLGKVIFLAKVMGSLGKVLLNRALESLEFHTNNYCSWGGWGCQWCIWSFKV